MIERVTITDLQTETKNAIAQVTDADRRALRLIRELFPLGSRVRWMHGDNVRSGIVRDSSGFNIGTLRFNIESKSGRTCWIGAYRLLSFIGLRD